MAQNPLPAQAFAKGPTGQLFQIRCDANGDVIAASSTVAGAATIYVNSVTGSDTTGNGSISAPYATTAKANTVAVSGDVVVWEAGHAETITAAGGVTLGVSGVSYVSLGRGATRATFTFTTSTAASFLISGSNVSVANALFVGDYASIVSAISITGSNVTLGVAGMPVTYQDTSAALTALRAVLATSVVGLSINMTYIGVITTTVAVNAIRLVGCSNVTININAYGKVSTSFVEFSGTACTNVLVNGFMFCSGTTNGSKDVVDTITGSTWYASIYDGAAGSLYGGGSGQAFGPADPSDVLAIQENVAVTSAAVISNGLTLFNIVGGPVLITGLVSICATANNSTASTLQYSSTGTLGSTSQTISGASASLASATAGTTVTAQFTALSTAPLVNANAANIAGTGLGIVAPAGSLTAVVGVGSTTGTWTHYLRYKPLAKGATVTNAF